MLHHSIREKEKNITFYYSESKTEYILMLKYGLVKTFFQNYFHYTYTLIIQPTTEIFKIYIVHVSTVKFR